MIDSLSGFLNTILVVALGVIGWIINESLGISRSKKKSMITPKAYANMKRGFPHTTMSSQPSF